MGDMRKKRGRPRAASSTVSLAAATAFIALATTLGFFGDHLDHTDGWRLRGTIAPDAGLGPAAQLPAARKPV